LTAVGIKFLPPSRTAIAAHFGLANFPVAYCGLKIITSLALRFPDFQRGRKKWKSQGGYPTLTHGGLSLLEMAVPYLELSK